MNMAMIQKMQRDMMKAQQEIEESVFVGTAGSGNVKIEMNGKKEVLNVSIGADVIDPEDPSLLEDLILVALNDAAKQADSKTEATMGKLTGGMKIPGLF